MLRYIYNHVINVKLNRSVMRCFSQQYLKRFTEEETNYNGVFLEVHTTENYEKEDFSADLLNFLKKWKNTQRRSAFLKIPISMSHCISIAAKYGFEYHHAIGDTAVLCIWLQELTDNKIPLYAYHTVGVAGACYNESTSELLVVQDKGRFSKWWKLPGGYSNKGEFIGETAVREVREETGIITEFKSVLSLRQQHKGIFDQSDIYFICRLFPITYDIKHCPDEILSCRWAKLDELFHMTDVSPFVKLVCKLILHGKSCDFGNVDIIEEEIVSWVVKNKIMKLYHRPLN